MSTTIEQPYLAFVEGKDDKAVIELVLDSMAIANVQVMNAEGVDKFRKLVRAAPALPGFDEKVVRLAILLDADHDPAAAEQSCRDILSAVAKPGSVFLFPGDGPGVLEDLCLRALEGRQEMDCVESYLDCLAGKGIQLTRPSKFRMRAMLTALDDGKNRDTWWAAGEGLLDPAHPAFEPLRTFLLEFTRA